LVNNGGHRLQLIQQWWLPIVNGWCQPFAAHAMATTQHSWCEKEKEILANLDIFFYLIAGNIV